LCVIGLNQKAHHFYRSLAFELDGARSLFAAWENIEELRMTR
jgi:hypothetical protein